SKEGTAPLPGKGGRRKPPPQFAGGNRKNIRRPVPALRERHHRKPSLSQRLAHIYGQGHSPRPLCGQSSLIDPKRSPEKQGFPGPYLHFISLIVGTVPPIPAIGRWIR